jgi:hypothetical protein
MSIKSNYKPQANDTNIDADMYLFARLRKLSLSQRLKIFAAHIRDKYRHTSSTS